ncbi:MAG: cysteine desulfurase family protein [Candidatus Komeilibacteria bacterium]
MSLIYLDHAATTYLLPPVEAAMRPFWSQQYGNPSSLSVLGLSAAGALTEARQIVAGVLGAANDEIVFVGSGTESDNLALQGVAQAMNEMGEIIVSAIEHPAVLRAADYLATLGWQVKIAPVTNKGLVTVDDLLPLLSDKTKLVSIMYANNEIGTVQPIAQLVKAVKEKYPTVLFHTDACQAAPYLDLDVRKLGVDLLSLNGSKVYGPKGTGLLYVKRGVKLKPMIYGGGQENGRRSGTENLPGIIGLSTALQLASRRRVSESKRVRALRDRLWKGLQKIDKVFLNGDKSQRLPNNLNVTFADVEGEAMLLELNEHGIVASTGSACASHNLSVSHVLQAIGLRYEMIHGSIRFTLGYKNTVAQIDKVIEIMPRIVNRLRSLSPVNLQPGKAHPQVKK